MAKSPASDPQREELYRLEKQCFRGMDYAKLTLPQMQSWLERAVRNYGTAPCSLVTQDMGTVRVGEYWDGRIVVSSRKGWGKTLFVLAHEFAHHLHGCLIEDRDHAWHDPGFMACYMHVLHTRRMVPVDAMRVLCDRYKVQYLPWKKLPSVDSLRCLVQRGRA